MTVLFRIVLDLAIIFGAYKMDQTGYGCVFATVAILRYELGPCMRDEDLP